MTRGALSKRQAAAAAAAVATPEPATKQQQAKGKGKQSAGQENVAPATVANKELKQADHPQPGSASLRKKKAEPASSGSSEGSQDSEASITDSELLDMVVPHDLVEEEHRLHQNRAAKTPPAPASGTCEPLENNRFAALERLLQQSEEYSRFMCEQVHVMEEELLQGQAAAGAAASKTVAKRGKGKRAKLDPAAAEAEAKAHKELIPDLKAELKDYQIKGVNWLTSLYQNGVNGILADQMGLGKTVQTIAFLAYLKSKGSHGPFIVIAPLSTLLNWMDEFRRFLPSTNTLLYHGSREKRAQLRQQLTFKGDRAPPDFPVIITSYEIAIADEKPLGKYTYTYMVVDEGHRLKNTDCQLIRVLRTFRTNNKLLLTGTPLQNNLAELWSLLNFLMPEVFGNVQDFETWFNLSSVVSSQVDQQTNTEEIVAAEQRNKVLTKLHAILKPFMLRRLKVDVDLAIPAKMEVVLYADKTAAQAKIIKQIKDKTLNLERPADMPVASFNNVMMQLRKTCNHPDLITSKFEVDPTFPPPEVLVEQCGKMQLLDRLLKKLHATKHKVLVFSQMVAMLDIIHTYAEQQGIKVCRLDGSMAWQTRADNITSFNTEEDAWLFLLSTRAGGLGINLTAADTVIIYDSDWNPHQDLQAMDRVHRIGQTKPVVVFRLATSHSIEGRMLKRAATKMVLERLVIKKGAFKEVGGSKKASGGAGSGQADDSMALSAAELLEMLKEDYKMHDIPQSGVVDDQMLDRLLDRQHLALEQPLPYPASGVGYEVVSTSSNTNGTLLHQINND